MYRFAKEEVYEGFQLRKLVDVVSNHPGRTHREVRIRPEGVVLPAPAVCQALGLSHRGEQFSVEELIQEPAVERLSKAVLSRGAWPDVGGPHTAFLGPAP